MEENFINIGKVKMSSLAKNMIKDEDLNIAINKMKHRDFGDLCDMETLIQLNHIEYKDKKRMKLFGIYKSCNDDEFYLIVNEDRKTTKVLLCYEYEELEIM